MADRCLHDFLPGQCAICLGHDRVETLADVRIERVLKARFDGRCAVDKTHGINSGDDIGLIESGGYACPSCTTEAAS